MEITKITLKLEHSNGCYTNLETVVPKEVADSLLNNISVWKYTTHASIKELEEYQKKVEEYKFK